MLSFANTHFSFYLFILCIAGLAASAPITYRHHLDSPFPYGKLADKLLDVNIVSYTVDDDLDEDIVRIYSSPGPPIASFDPMQPVLLPIYDTSIPNIGITKNNILSSFDFAYRIPDVIKKVVVREWDAALVRWHTVMM